MVRGAPPVWLRRPSRFAGLARGPAITVLIALGVLILFCLTTLGTAAPGDGMSGNAPPAGQQDIYLYGSIVSGLRAGGDYYGVAVEALRAGNFPLKPFFTFRLPTLAVVEAALPAWGVAMLLYLLAACVAAAWFVRLRDALAARPAPLAAAMVALMAGMLACVQTDIAAFHEIWAAQLIALSLALWRPDRWLESIAVALMAMLIRETAALYTIIMALFAFRSGRRGELAGWGAALAIFAVAVGLHAYAVSQVVGPLDPASPGWAGLNGFGFFTRALILSTALQALPLWLGAILVAGAWWGWAAWDDPLAIRALAVFAAYALLVGIAARQDNFYWALLVAPAFPIGLAFLPDGVRDLVSAALDRRHVRVQRITR
ncbi:hypothetical protein [Stakelama saccharophila]|uniref:Uncharacterized protein n=1 Tax=Stakelama saccharophila TaxID=3075605 RepID=A0ABZ0B817_9SPHN|nr:hypothetical protein [Stakelama sp. W311]WNO53003.1 hypothetical protein RPR59_11125 [Stakelama sp. W311]